MWQIDSQRERATLVCVAQSTEEPDFDNNRKEFLSYSSLTKAGQLLLEVVTT